MIVNSFDFIWIFPIIFVIIIAINSLSARRRTRVANLFLLVVSYGIFWYYNHTLTLALAGVTLATYLGALAVRRFGKRKVLVAVTVVIALIPLLGFKYYNFISSNITSAMSAMGIDGKLPGLNYAIPLGISFFTLQAIGYFLDVANGKAEVERNLADYMLFVSFFPHIASGPISKAGDLMPQIKGERAFDADRATQGLKWLLWGMFMKVVVADNIGDAISSPLAHSAQYTSATVTLSVILYSMQIYCDFAGYSFMALGIGQLLGFELVNNFDRPYFSSSITEFWHRWHRSLSTWLKEHIYFPLGGSRCGKWRNYFNIMVTFLVSGLWHGANWTFLLWGGIHGGVQAVEKHFGWNKVAPKRRWLKVLKILLTFAVVTLAWVFFLQPSVGKAADTIAAMFTSAGNKTAPLLFPAVLAAVVVAKDLVDELGLRHLNVLHHRFAAVRWVSYSALIFMIMVFAVYGEKFIYSGF